MFTQAQSQSLPSLFPKGVGRRLLSWEEGHIKSIHVVVRVGRLRILPRGGIHTLPECKNVQ